MLATLSLIIFVSADRLLDPLRVAEQQGSTAPPACKLCRDTVKSFLAVNQICTTIHIIYSKMTEIHEFVVFIKGNEKN